MMGVLLALVSGMLIWAVAEIWAKRSEVVSFLRQHYHVVYVVAGIVFLIWESGVLRKRK
jgi:hypothetical protein